MLLVQVVINFGFDMKIRTNGRRWCTQQEYHRNKGEVSQFHRSS